MTGALIPYRLGPGVKAGRTDSPGVVMSDMEKGRLSTTVGGMEDYLKSRFRC